MFAPHRVLDITDNEHPFNYLGRDKKGPKNWGHLNPKWKVCETGKLQSPMDLLDDRVAVLPTQKCETQLQAIFSRSQKPGARYIGNTDRYTKEINLWETWSSLIVRWYGTEMLEVLNR